MLLLKHVLGNFPWSPGVSTSHFCSGMVTGRLLVLAQSEKGCILLCYIMLLPSPRRLNPCSGEVSGFTGIAFSVSSEDERPSSSVGRRHPCFEVVREENHGSLPTPDGDYSSTSVCQAGPVVAFSGFVDISGGNSQSGSFPLGQEAIPLPFSTNLPLQPPSSLFVDYILPTFFSYLLISSQSLLSQAKHMLFYFSLVNQLLCPFHHVLLLSSELCSLWAHVSGC